MRIRTIHAGAWGANCYLLISGTHAAVVDPSAQTEVILSALAEEGATAEMILLTHGHFDHIVSLDTLRDQTGVPALIHENDLDMPENALKNCFLTLFGMEKTYRRPDGTFAEGDLLPLGTESIRVIHTPGHTAGSVCFLCNDEFLLTGDTVLQFTHGRTDVYSSSDEQMRASLLRLRTGFSGDLPIYPGHGHSSTLGKMLDAIFL